jgi:hypothetical protein
MWRPHIESVVSEDEVETVGLGGEILERFLNEVDVGERQVFQRHDQSPAIPGTISAVIWPISADF